MGGVFKIGNGGKHQTNLRSALVESGAALTSYRRKFEVPYDLSKIYEQENIGRLFKDLLKDRFKSIGYNEADDDAQFYELAYKNNFHKAISLSEEQFKNWLEGKAIFQIKKFKYDLEGLKENYQSIQCLKIDQWLNEWNEVDFDLPMRRKPDEFFYFFKIDIRLLKRISDVHRRSNQKRRIDDVNVQRSLKEDRSLEIKNYVHKGFPLIRQFIYRRDNNVISSIGLYSNQKAVLQY